jgi:hypothetical protein
MVEDVAGSVKTAVGAAVTTVTEVLKKAPRREAPVKQVAKKLPPEDRKKQGTKRARYSNGAFISGCQFKGFLAQ